MAGRSDETKDDVAYKYHGRVQSILSWGVFAGGLLYGTKYLPNWLQGKPKTFFSIIGLFGIATKSGVYQLFTRWLGKTSKGNDSEVGVIRSAIHFMTAAIWHQQLSKGKVDVICPARHFMTAVLWHQLITAISHQRKNQENLYRSFPYLHVPVEDIPPSKFYELFTSSREDKYKTLIKDLTSKIKSGTEKQKQFINDFVAKSNKTHAATTQSFGNLKTRVETPLKHIENPGNISLVEWLHNQADSYWVLYLAMGSFLLFDTYISHRSRKGSRKDEFTPTENQSDNRSREELQKDESTPTENQSDNSSREELQKDESTSSQHQSS